MKVMRLRAGDFDYTLESPVLLEGYDIKKDMAGKGFRTKSGFWVSWYLDQYKEFNFRISNLNRRQIEKMEEAFLKCKEYGGMMLEILNLYQNNIDQNYENMYIVDFSAPVEYEYNNELDVYSVDIKLVEIGGYYYNIGDWDLSNDLPPYEDLFYFYVGQDDGKISKYQMTDAGPVFITDWQAFASSLDVQHLAANDYYILACSMEVALTEVCLKLFNTFGIHEADITTRGSGVGDSLQAPQGLEIYPDRDNYVNVFLYAAESMTSNKFKRWRLDGEYLNDLFEAINNSDICITEREYNTEFKLALWTLGRGYNQQLTQLEITFSATGLYKDIILWDCYLGYWLLIDKALKTARYATENGQFVKDQAMNFEPMTADMPIRRGYKMKQPALFYTSTAKKLMVIDFARDPVVEYQMTEAGEHCVSVACARDIHERDY